MVKTSQPYSPGGTDAWTSYTYDFLGRTLAVTLPDGASTTKYTYQGNWTTVADPAGKWKQYQSDVFGNVLNAVEPDPLASPVLTTAPSTPSTSVTGTLVTSYTYDALNHLVNVSMPRAGGDADADVHLRSGDAAVDEHDESGDGDEVAAGEWNDFVYLQRGRNAGHADGPEGSGD